MVAVGLHEHDAEQQAQQAPVAEFEQTAEDPWDAAEAEIDARPRRNMLPATLAALAILGWTGFFGWANLPQIADGATPQQWIGWIGQWSLPVALIGVVWLLAMRHSTREAGRFGDAAQMLSLESQRLEQRLQVVNRELSLAREFLAAQARDMDSLGRLATERLAEHSARLAGLIGDNGARLETIGTVSEAALDNMEKLRGQLPVIASAAKDVTNNIGTAGRSAHAQLEDMVAGFAKLNQFGQASERQVLNLRDLVERTLGEFTAQSEQLGTIAENRFAALADHGATFRSQLDQDEVAALAAIQTRAAAMANELSQARAALEQEEAESLISLRARLSAVREEAGVIGRALRDGENQAIGSWKQAVAQLEVDLNSAIARVGEIDEKAMASARSRLAQLASEAEQVDSRFAERDRLFAEQIEERQQAAQLRHDAVLAQIEAQLAGIDAAIAARRTEHEAQTERLAAHSKAIAAELELVAERLQQAAQHGTQAETDIAGGLSMLAERLTASRAALDGTDAAIAELTDSSVRLLELIQASVQHTSQNLPAAIAVSEDRLTGLEQRSLGIAATLTEAEGKGEQLSNYVMKSHTELTDAMTAISASHTALDRYAANHAEALAALGNSLQQLEADSERVAARAKGELQDSITSLDHAARQAVGGIEQFSAASVTALAARLGEESGAAIERTMRAKTAEVVGTLEQAAAHAAGVSREAAIQLRDQLTKVDELAGNLERRVAQARSRAEEQVDNDFARRVALITEALNSNAIDIARALDAEVTDTAWAAYLRGDRGVFTRRAVRLLEPAEVKAVTQIYEDDQAFRGHVSRYIHDFEAMLRQLLSTRDGHALGVTLLSSDMGKLYVALAQAIERLRN